ncbi:hypothetical protein [Alkalinema sp. FACHB-956]|uniref:DUF7925 domain-containing protein n=1 Tax=Alkalinema sp. FACHB-956 TaxID=2692768 RepID=UPI00168887DC|nr:hypothetical protein [Alkalinema sp. FACHB-956]MBD2329353.1 hypothetical protein [Alkalinema sp. FACHB-956]
MQVKNRAAYRRLLAATLMVGSTLPLALPLLAETPVGTPISNTATATYEDPNGTTFNATSNTVTVTIAEVAGVFVTPLATIDQNGGSVLPNDVINYEFKVENAGNDTTQLFIPPTPSVTGPGSATQTFITGYIDANGNRTNFAPVAVTANPTGSIAGLPAIGANPAGVLPAGFSYVVSVPVTVSNLAASGANIVVRLGDTGPNDNTTATQNQPDAPDNALNTEVRTVDYAGETGPASAVLPASAEREASAVQTVTVGSQAQALATILKNRLAVNAQDPAKLEDDIITYGLGLEVESTAPAGSVGITPGKLVGITVNGVGANRVLVSDAVPTSTALTSAADVKAPANWTAVYTTDALSVPATQANWSTTFSAAATRIGFVYDTGVNGPINEGTTVTGFEFKVITSGIPVGSTTPVNIANIAQVMGQTQGNTGPTAPLVYDESGDQNPSNFNDNGSPFVPPGGTILTPGSNNVPTGQANPTNDGVDNNNDNSGVGPGGEDNVYTVALPGTVLNGPAGVPGAVGPTNNNDDFTNRSTNVPANIAPGQTVDFTATTIDATFQNSISNPDTINPLTNILLVPDTLGFTPSSQEILPPDGTKVTITYGGQSAVYRYDAGVGNFVFESGTAILIPTLAPGQTINYGVSVDLPGATPQSTDTGVGYSIPIYAFKDVDGDSRPDPAETTQNRTIDRVYVGYLKLRKQAQILDTDGTTVLQAYTDNNALLASKAAPGRTIEYRITYENISIAPVGTGNIILDAQNITITENGDNGTNTWAQELNGEIITSHVTGSVVVTYGTTTYNPSGEQTGTTKAADVVEYVHRPGVVIQPGASGSFTFKRKIN